MLNKNLNDSEYETGIVTEIHDNELTVELNPNNACESCGARVVCSPNSNGKRIIIAENTIDAAVGQKVKIDENSDITLKITSFQYGLPLLGFILGLLASYILNLRFDPLPIELIQFINAMLGLFIFAGLSKWYIKEFAKKHFYFFSIKT
jgi:sigma-E factor negative regulatory protein RseC